MLRLLIKFAFYCAYLCLDMLTRLHPKDFFYTVRVYLSVASLMKCESRLMLAFEGVRYG